MKAERTNGHSWTLTAENDADEDFIGEVDVWTHIAIAKRHYTRRGNHYASTGATLYVGPPPQPSVPEALNKLGRSVSDLLGLLARQPAFNGHVGTLATNPQAQEPLPADLVQLQIMLQSRGYAVVKQQVVEEVIGTHGEASKSVDTPPIVKHTQTGHTTPANTAVAAAMALALAWLGPTVLDGPPKGPGTYSAYGYTPAQLDPGQAALLDAQARAACDRRAHGTEGGYIAIADGGVMCTDKRSL